MGLYNSCELPWISTVVNNYLANPPQYRSLVDFSMCCLTPGDCTYQPVSGTCPMGYLDCHMGNSRFTCRFDRATGQGPTCFQEGSLANTRNMPCCGSQVYDFLKTQECIGAFGTVGDANVCCTSKTDVTSCKYVIGCIGYTPYYCQGGVTSSVCWGYDPNGTGLDKCVSELNLVNEVKESCMSMSFPSSGCALGGSGPPAPPPQPSTPTAPSGTRTGTKTTATGTDSSPTGVLLPSSGSKAVAKKWLAVCLVAPVLVQMLLV
ncbi:hypothetical protein BG004_004362 [Podila humilis]|nr:hypothetical protein BG004_004362 [Podila humilis]